MCRHARALAVLVLFSSVAAAFAAPPAPGKRGRLEPPPHALSRDNLEQARTRLASGVPAPRKALADTTRLVALRIEFPDLAFGASPPADELHDAFYYRTQFGYASQYFAAASASRLVLRIDVPDVVATAALPQTRYGDFAAYDSLMVRLASEAIAAADPVVDFSLYDGVLLVHAGPGQESDIAGNSPDQIWSGYLDGSTVSDELSLPDSTVEGIVTTDGVPVRSFAVLPEWEVQDLEVTGGTRLGSLGVYAHEIGQSLGMIPLFDGSPGSFPDSQGLGNFDVMAYGLWVANGFIPSLPSAFNRLLMGWVTPIEVDGSATVALRDLERGPADSTVARVRISEREYFLVSYIVEDPDGPVVEICSGEPVGPRRFFEFDDQNGNCRFDYEDVNGDSVLSQGDLVDSYTGAEWDFFMTDFQASGTAGQGYGLLVLHVDEQVLQEVLRGGSTNVQGDAHRKAVDVEEADGIQDLDRIPDNPRSFGSADDYFVRGLELGPATSPDTRSTNGAPTGIRIVLDALPDSMAAIPGAQARIRVERVAATAAAPQFTVRRALPGALGSDLVALPLADGRRALVVPADSGQVLLADANLDEAPVSDGDPGTLAPWITLPPELGGRWVAAPAVGDVDGDGAADVVLCADVDSAGAPVGRVFAWRRDGTELVDFDNNPLTNTGLVASFAGRVSTPVVFDADGDAKSEIYVVREDTTQGFTQARRYVHTAAAWLVAVSIPWDGRAPSAPIVVGWPSPNPDRALAWVDDKAVHFETFEIPGSGLYPRLELPSERGPARLVFANLDAVGDGELVTVSQDGVLSIVTLDAPTIQSSGAVLPVTDRLAAGAVAPLSLADLDGNGTLEILLATESAMHVLSATGAALHGWPYPFRYEPELEREPEPGRGAGSPLAADLDGDGDLEIGLHLPGGAWLVWDAGGTRRRDLEAALPARGGPTPLVADLDASPGLELASIGSFAVSRRYLAEPESLVTTVQSEIAVWKLAAAGDVAWGEWGGGPGHAFFDGLSRDVQPAPNDAALSSFAIGPNPAAAEARARVTLTAAARVRCRLFTLEGEAVRDSERDGAPGTIVEIPIDLRGLASGTYLVQLELSTGGRRVRPLAVRR